MEAAVEVLVDWEEGFPTGTLLVAKLVDMGVLQHVVDDGLLLQHLKRHVRKTGHILIVDSTKTVFFITAGDVVERVKFAHKMVVDLESQEEGMIIFVGETTLEESPHPKGERDGRESGEGQSQIMWIVWGMHEQLTIPGCSDASPIVDGWSSGDHRA